MLSEKQFLNKIAIIIRQQRILHKYSCEKLAALSEIDYSSLNLIENEHQSPKAYTLYKILSALGIDTFPIIQEESPDFSKMEKKLINKIMELSVNEQECLLNFLEQFKISIK